MRKAMADKRDAAKERQRKERMVVSAAVRAALANASAVTARAQAACGKRVREVCDNADRVCVAAAEEEERAIKRQLDCAMAFRVVGAAVVACICRTRRAGIL